MIGEHKLREDKQQPCPERMQTDESLRVERTEIDDAFGLTFRALEQLAEAVIEKARLRADAVLATARAREDRIRDQAHARLSGLFARSRVREDAAIRREREEAEEALRREREEAEEVLRQEREDADEMLGTEISLQSNHLDALRRHTDDHLLEERSRSDDELATRDEFLGIVSHDLRNMLSLMMTSAAIIERAMSHQNNADMVRLNAQRIQSMGGRMSLLIGDLVDVASIEAGALAVSHELVDPSALVSNAVEIFQSQAVAAEITLLAEVIPPVPLVRFDPFRIFQVLSNLLTNAIKFTPRQGRIVLRVEQLGDELRFGVRDTGPGIAADKLGVIFERFHQLAPTDHRGVGLGLYISKCIVQGHNGKIWAESEVGEGTIFYFTLPIPRDP